MSGVFRNHYGEWREGWALAGILALGCAAVAAILALMFSAILPLAYYSERSSCRAFGQQTGREVRFVHLVEVGVPLSWDCLVSTADGRWISRSQLRAQEDS